MFPLRSFSNILTSRQPGRQARASIARGLLIAAALISGGCATIKPPDEMVAKAYFGYSPENVEQAQAIIAEYYRSRGLRPENDWIGGTHRIKCTLYADPAWIRFLGWPDPAPEYVFGWLTRCFESGVLGMQPSFLQSHATYYLIRDERVIYVYGTGASQSITHGFIKKPMPDK